MGFGAGGVEVVARPGSSRPTKAPTAPMRKPPAGADAAGPDSSNIILNRGLGDLALERFGAAGSSWLNTRESIRATASPFSGGRARRRHVARQRRFLAPEYAAEQA